MTQTTSINIPGSYTVRAVDASGCIGTSLPFVVSTKPKPSTPSIQVNGATRICPGDFRTLTGISTSSPVTYTWYNASAIPPVNLGTTQSINVINPGVYQLYVRGANGCTSNDTSVTITRANLPTGVIAINDTAICQGDSVQLKVNTPDSVSVLWSNGASGKTVWVKTAGSYSAQLSTSQGCSNAATGNVTVQVVPRPAVTISQSGNVLTANPVANSYLWYLNGAAINGANSQSLTITSGGNYSVIVKNVAGCAATASYAAVLRVMNPSLTYQVAPNPATDRIHIHYTLNQSEKVSISIKNQQGQHLMTLVDNRQQAAGDYQFSFSSIGLPKGLVFIEFHIGGKVIVHKQIIL